MTSGKSPAASAAVASVGEEERRSLAFTARVDASRLDGRPALILEYPNKGTGAGDSFWGRTLGMRDELREVRELKQQLEELSKEHELTSARCAELEATLATTKEGR